MASTDEASIALEAVTPGLSREITRLLFLLGGAAALFALFYFTPLGSIARDVQQVRAFLQGDDPWAELTYFGLVAALVAMGMPRLVFFGIGGLVFGFWQGLLLAQLGSLTGAFLVFCAVRRGGRDWFGARFGEHRVIGRILRVRSSVKAVVLIRQLPLHCLMVTGGLALGEASARVFLVGSFIGFLPQGIIATLIGSGLVDEQAAAGFSKLLLAAVVLIGGGVLLRHWRQAQRKS